MTTKELKKELKTSLSKYKWIKHNGRKDIALKMNCSRQNIDNYFDGKIANMEFAEKLIKHLSKIKRA